MTFNEAKQIFSKCRNKAKGARLEGRFTRLVQCDDGFGIQYHDTVVVTIHADGTYTLTTGGFFTKTTKERINQYSPARVYSLKRIWHINGGQKYNDGMRVDAKGVPVELGDVNQSYRIETVLKRIDKYADGFVTALKQNKVPQPSGGDCWGCCMRDVNTGKTVMGTEHLESHLEENYFVPSLLVNAIEATGYNPQYVNPWNGLRNDTDTFKRAIKSYLRKALCK